MTDRKSPEEIAKEIVFTQAVVSQDRMMNDVLIRAIAQAIQADRNAIEWPSEDEIKFASGYYTKERFDIESEQYEWKAARDGFKAGVEWLKNWRAKR